MTSDLLPVLIDYATEFVPASEDEELLVSVYNEPLPLWARRFFRLFGEYPDVELWVTWQRRAAQEAIPLMRDKSKWRAVDGGRPLDRGIITLQAQTRKDER